MSKPTLSRREISASTKLLKQLKEDHQRVKNAHAHFKKLDASKDRAKREALVTQVLDDLEVHAAVEEQLLYPASRTALDAHALLDEAEVEHQSVRALISQLRGVRAGDGAANPKYAARFNVLCKYVQQHVKEEEGQLFPKLRQAHIGWEDLASRMDARRKELLGSVAVEGDAAPARGSYSAAHAPAGIGPGRGR